MLMPAPPLGSNADITTATTTTSSIRVQLSQQRTSRHHAKALHIRVVAALAPVIHVAALSTGVHAGKTQMQVVVLGLVPPWAARLGRGRPCASAW